MLSANAAAPRTRPRICIPRPVIEPSCPDRRCGLDLIGTPNGRKRKALVRVNAPHAAPVVQLCGKPDQRSPERHQALSSEGGMSDRANANTMIVPWRKTLSKRPREIILTLPQHLRLPRSRSAVNLNKAYALGLDAPSSTFVGRPLRADPFDAGLAKSKDSRKCGNCSFMPAFV